MSIVEDISLFARARRLKEARGRVYPSAEKAAQALGMKGVTVRAHENAQNGFPLDIASAYAGAYGVSLDWLLTGREGGQPPPAPIAPASRSAPVALTTLGNGKARLDMSVTLPFSVALQILALVEEAQK